jgi:asparagine synthetase B (glutamine-hydrolysing)
MSDHGKEVRFPFLACSLVQFLSRLPVYFKCDPRYRKGVGEKQLLRLMAKELGLEATSVQEKRAVQFGSRTAKMDLGSGKSTGDTSLV